MLSRYQPFLQILRELSPDLHVAGGAVKDCLLGVPVADVDIVFPRGQEHIAARFAERTGAARVTFREGEPDRSTERVIAGAGSAPLLFDFTAQRGACIEEDLARRDFTVTAMALPLDAFTGGDFSRLVDPLGGRSDLRDGLIRSVSDGSFRQDPLRLLREIMGSGLVCQHFSFCLSREPADGCVKGFGLPAWYKTPGYSQMIGSKNV